MSKHTPGPWYRDKYGNVVSGNGERVVMRSVAVACSGSDEYIALAEANTDLATAAPDLLEALEIITNELASVLDSEWSCKESDCPEIVQARKAIARAKGEPQ